MSNFDLKIDIKELKPYVLIKPICCETNIKSDDIVVSFEDCIFASGETINEATENIKDMIIATYELLISKKLEELGPVPKKQLLALKQYIKDCA